MRESFAKCKTSLKKQAFTEKAERLGQSGPQVPVRSSKKSGAPHEKIARIQDNSSGKADAPNEKAARVPDRYCKDTQKRWQKKKEQRISGAPIPVLLI